MDRDILHIDANNFYASCECAVNPKIKNLPVVVGGSSEERKGVVIAKNYIAKSKGIDVGMTIHEASKICPNLVSIRPNFKLYNEFSKKLRDIYLSFTDEVEPFSIDECWLDVTHSKVFGSPKEIADKIRERVKNELNLTVSVGVSFNKLFAKLASDLKKPDFTTEITRENYKEIVWKLPITSMVGVGKKILVKLEKMGIETIGDLAKSDQNFMAKKFGKIGYELCEFARGNDKRKVEEYEKILPPKSLGNSTTFYRDLNNIDEIKLGFTILAETVVERMMQYGVKKAQIMSIKIKNSNFESFRKQMRFDFPCRSSNIIIKNAMKLYRENFSHIKDIRKLGISVSQLIYHDQIDLFNNLKGDIDETVVNLRKKYGYDIIRKGNCFIDKKIADSFKNRESIRKK